MATPTDNQQMPGTEPQYMPGVEQQPEDPMAILAQSTRPRQQTGAQAPQSQTGSSGAPEYTSAAQAAREYQPPEDPMLALARSTRPPQGRTQTPRDQQPDRRQFLPAHQFGIEAEPQDREDQGYGSMLGERFVRGLRSAGAGIAAGMGALPFVPTPVQDDGSFWWTGESPITPHWEPGEKPSRDDKLQHAINVQHYKELQRQQDPIETGNFAKDILLDTAEMAGPMIASIGLGAGTKGAGTVAFWGMQGYGQTYGRLVQDGVDDDVARLAGVLPSVGYGMLAKLQASKMFPGAYQKATAAITKPSVEATRRLMGVLGQYGLNVGSQIGIEMGQEGLMVTGEEVGRAYQLARTPEREINQQTIGESLRRMAQAGIHAAGPMAIMSAPGAVVAGARAVGDQKMDGDGQEFNAGVQQALNEHPARDRFMQSEIPEQEFTRFQIRDLKNIFQDPEYAARREQNDFVEQDGEQIPDFKRNATREHREGYAKIQRGNRTAMVANMPVNNLVAVGIPGRNGVPYGWDLVNADTGQVQRVYKNGELTNPEDARFKTVEEAWEGALTLERVDNEAAAASRERNEAQQMVRQYGRTGPRMPEQPQQPAQQPIRPINVRGGREPRQPASRADAIRRRTFAQEQEQQAFEREAQAAPTPFEQGYQRRGLDPRQRAIQEADTLRAQLRQQGVDPDELRSVDALALQPTLTAEDRLALAQAQARRESPEGGAGAVGPVAQELAAQMRAMPEQSGQAPPNVGQQQGWYQPSQEQRSEAAQQRARMRQQQQAAQPQRQQRYQQQQREQPAAEQPVQQQPVQQRPEQQQQEVLERYGVRYSEPVKRQIEIDQHVKSFRQDNRSRRIHLGKSYAWEDVNSKYTPRKHPGWLVKNRDPQRRSRQIDVVLQEAIDEGLLPQDASISDLDALMSPGNLIAQWETVVPEQPYFPVMHGRETAQAIRDRSVLLHGERNRLWAKRIQEGKLPPDEQARLDRLVERYGEPQEGNDVRILDANVRREADQPRAAAPAEAAPDLLQALSLAEDPVTPDLIAERTGMSQDHVASELNRLEQEGMIIRTDEGVTLTGDARASAAMFRAEEFAGEDLSGFWDVDALQEPLGDDWLLGEMRPREEPGPGSSPDARYAQRPEDIPVRLREDMFMDPATGEARERFRPVIERRHPVFPRIPSVTSRDGVTVSQLAWQTDQSRDYVRKVIDEGVQNGAVTEIEGQPGHYRLSRRGTTAVHGLDAVKRAREPAQETPLEFPEPTPQAIRRVAFHDGALDVREILTEFGVDRETAGRLVDVMRDSEPDIPVRQERVERQSQAERRWTLARVREFLDQGRQDEVPSEAMARYQEAQARRRPAEDVMEPVGQRRRAESQEINNNLQRIIPDDLRRKRGVKSDADQFRDMIGRVTEVTGEMLAADGRRYKPTYLGQLEKEFENSFDALFDTPMDQWHPQLQEWYREGKAMFRAVEQQTTGKRGVMSTRIKHEPNHPVRTLADQLEQGMGEQFEIIVHGDSATMRAENGITIRVERRQEGDITPSDLRNFAESIVEDPANKGRTVTLPDGTERTVPETTQELLDNPEIMDAFEPEATFRLLDQQDGGATDYRADAFMELVDTADPDAVSHEVTHAAMRTTLNPLEYDALMQRFGNEEAAVQAVLDARGRTEGVMGTLRQFWHRVRAMVDSLRGRVYVPRLVQQIAEGDVWRRSPHYERAGAGTAYSAKNKANPVYEQYERKLRENLEDLQAGRTPRHQPEYAYVVPGEEGRAFQNVMDESWEPEAYPEFEQLADAEQLVHDVGFDGVIGKMKEKNRRSEELTPAETQAMKLYFARQGPDLMQSEEGFARLQEIYTEYRGTGTTTAQSLASRHGMPRGSSQADRASHDIMKSLMEPTPRQRRKLTQLRKQLRKQLDMEELNAAARTRSKINRIHQDIRKQAERARAGLTGRGFDLSREGLEAISQDPYKLGEVKRIISSERSSILDKIIEFQLDMLLSAPPTHAVNVGTTSAFTAWELGPQRSMEAAINLVHRNPDAASFGEFKHMYRGLATGFREGLRNARQTFQTEMPVIGERGPMDPSTPGFERGVAIGGRTGRALRAPSLRLMLAGDQFTKTVSGYMQAGALAYRIGRRKGLQGQEMSNFIEASVANKDSAAWKGALDFAEYTAFQNDLGEAGQQIMAFREAVPISRLQIPFMRTPLNLLKVGLRKSPAGSFALAYRLMADPGSFRDGATITRAAEQVLAWGATWALYESLNIGRDDEDPPLITGSTPWRATSVGERELAYRYAPPQSIRTPNGYVSYMRFDPFATAMTTVVDALNGLRRAQQGESLEDAGQRATQTMGSLIQDKTFLQGVQAIMDVIETGDATNFATRLAGTFSPNMMKTALRARDPQIPDTQIAEISQRFQEQIAPRTAGIPPRVDLYGRESEIGGTALSRFVSPFRFSPTKERSQTEQKADRMMFRWNQKNPNNQYAPGQMSNKFSFAGADPTTPTVLSEQYEYTPAEYQELQQTAGDLTVRFLAGMNLNWDNPSKQDVELMDNMIRQARQIARGMVQPKAQARVLREQQQQRAGAGMG